MMLPPPRVIAIDDDPKHLIGLTEGLNQYGTACSPIRFTGDTKSVQPCPHVRVIFADLNLISGPAGPTGNFGTIGGLIEEKIKPSGPYFIILWTIYPEEADKLHNFLNNRLQDVKKPFAVQSLDKKDHLDDEGSVKNTERLAETIRTMIAAQPQVAALLDWEAQTSDAAADTVSSILELAEETPAGSSLDKETGRLLATLAAAAVGKEHVEEDRFRAVNEALLPILADRIASKRSSIVDGKTWQEAFENADTGRTLSLAKAAKLNRLLHIETSTDASTGNERGAVIDLPRKFSGQMFKTTFGIAQDTAAHKQFLCQDIDEHDEKIQWVLVQSQAACDYAQPKPGPLPFHLGLFLTVSKVGKDKAPAALWTSPSFEFKGKFSLLHVNARFQISLSPNAKTVKTKPLFRLREQLLNDMIYQLHSHGARPGIISFRESKKQSKQGVSSVESSRKNSKQARTTFRKR